MNIEQAFNVMKSVILKPVENNNIYIPPNGVTEVDRRKYFTNYNEDLRTKVQTIKFNK